MREVHAKQALVGDNLELQENVCLYLDEKNRILDIDKHTSDSNIVAVPGFFNAHVHAADIALRDRVGNDLHAVVGPGGIKHTYLNALDQEELTENIESSIAEGRLNGVLGYADFREGGMQGSIPYRSFPDSYIAMSRPKSQEIDNLPQSVNVGIRDVIAYTPDRQKQLVENVHRRNGIVQIHVSEDNKLRERWLEEYGVSDLHWAIERLKVDTVIHATLATGDDIELIAETDTGVVICPSSNRYFSIGDPPIKALLSTGVVVGLGSDNAMINPIAMWKEFEILSSMGIPSSTQVRLATTGGARTAGLEWGISPGNSHILLFDIPSSHSSSSLFSKLTDPKILDYLHEIITPIR